MQNLYPVLILSIWLISGCNKKAQPDYTQRTSYFRNIIPGIEMDSTIICVTFNIHHGFKATKDPWDKDVQGAGSDQVENIANILRQIDPDIVALQEVQRNRHNAILKKFLKALADELGMNYAFGAHGYNDPYGIEPVEGEWGNAILTKFEIESIENHEAEYRSVWERRSIINTRLRLNDSISIHALSLHWLPSDQAIPNTSSYLEKMDGPALVMGDYNYTGELPEFEALGFFDADSTFSTHAIDRIFYRKSSMRVLEMGVLPDTMLTSDHPANYAVLEMTQ